jgi:predicted negative regulator of RcsB-dependent stress response
LDMRISFLQGVKGASRVERRALCRGEASARRGIKSRARNAFARPDVQAA